MSYVYKGQDPVKKLVATEQIPIYSELNLCTFIRLSLEIIHFYISSAKEYNLKKQTMINFITFSSCHFLFGFISFTHEQLNTA